MRMLAKCSENFLTFSDKLLSNKSIIIFYKRQWRWKVIIYQIDNTNCTIPCIVELENDNSYHDHTHGIDYMIFNLRNNISISHKKFLDVSECIIKTITIRCDFNYHKGMRRCDTFWINEVLSIKSKMTRKLLLFYSFHLRSK